MDARDNPLKKIPVAELRLGMHLHAFEGSWLDHPFWTTRFVLKDSADIRRVLESPVRECWINTDRGLDLADEPAPDPAASNRNDSPALAPTPPTPLTAATAAFALTSPTPAPPAERPASTEMTEELRQAARLCARSREAVTTMFSEARMGRALDAERCLPLVDDITQSVFRNPDALVSLVRLKTQDDYTYMHSVAVCALMVALGRQMELDDVACREAGLAGLLHDLGKAAIPLDILNKPAKLTDDEFKVMRTHPQRGWQMLHDGHGASQVAMDVCLHHRERIDGGGYPHRLPGER